MAMCHYSPFPSPALSSLTSCLVMWPPNGEGSVLGRSVPGLSGLHESRGQTMIDKLKG